VARLLRTGGLARHIARARRLYADRRRAAVSALREIRGVVTMRGTDAGLHIVADLATGIDAQVLVAEAARQGVALVSLDDYRTVADPASPAIWSRRR
jgi:GntR family transcriptional regulator / MocR family aminotransferase